MTRLIESSSPSIGEPGRFERLTWPEFVVCVLELTVKAYQAMRRDNVAQRDWEENTFTLNLGKCYLHQIAYDNESSIHVHIEEQVYTPQMKTGQQSTREAKRIDMSMYGTWERNYDQIRFVWEAKRVGDKRIDPEYSDLNSEYVNEGIYRFIKGEYAGSLDDAGMLGYVLAGSVSNIVGDINASMGNIRKNPPLPDSDHLQKVTPIDNFEDLYRSNHIRTNQTHIRLHHLFLSFEFG